MANETPTIDDVNRVVHTLEAAGYVRGFHVLNPDHFHVVMMKGGHKYAITPETWEKAVRLADHEERGIEAAADLYATERAEASHEVDNLLGRNVDSVPTTDLF